MVAKATKSSYQTSYKRVKFPNGKTGSLLLEADGISLVGYKNRTGKERVYPWRQIVSYRANKATQRIPKIKLTLKDSKNINGDNRDVVLQFSTREEVVRLKSDISKFLAMAEAQHKDNVASLHEMFGAPWTTKLLGEVLDHCNGNVDEAATKLLTLDHKGNPEALVERLVKSDMQDESGSSPAPGQASASASAGTIVAIPESRQKENMSLQKQVSVDVTSADKSGQPSATIHEHNTRRRVGTPTMLPDDFLRIPKRQQPKKKKKKMEELLFDPRTLNQLSGMPATESSSLDATPPSRTSPSGSMEGKQFKLQALRNSFNFPSFSKSETASAKEVQKENKTQASSQGNASNLFSKFLGTKDASKPEQPKRSPAPPMGMFPPSIPTSIPAAHPTEPCSKPNEERQTDLLQASDYTKPSLDVKGPDPVKPLNQWIPLGSSTGRNKGWIMPGMSINSKADTDALPNAAAESIGMEPSKNGWGLPFGRILPENRASATGKSEQQQQPAHDQQRNGRGWSITTSIRASQQSATISLSEDLLIGDDKNDIQSDDTYGSIPQVEFRGISVRQLQQVVKEMQHHCTTDQWRSVETGQPLQPNQVSMYDFVRHYIAPRTKTRSCSYIEQAFGKQNYRDGLRSPKWFVSHTWSDSVMDLVQCIQQHATDRHTSDADNVTYWICAFAVNQHVVGTNVMDLDQMSDHSFLHDPRLTQKVLQVTEGMLAVIDQKDYFFSRIWCLWEVFLAINRAKASAQVRVIGETEDQYLLDVYTINDNGVCVGLTRGVAETDKYRSSDNNPTNGMLKEQPCHPSQWSEVQAVRQSQFRYQSCQAAMDVNLESTHASLEEDTRRIMNCIVQKKKDVNPNEAEALTSHPAYAHANALIQGTFAGMAYRHALEDSVGGRQDEFDCLSMEQVQSTLLGSPISYLEVSFASCKAFQIRQALKFMESLPTSLQQLELDYSFLDFKFAEEFAIGLSRLSDNLQSFTLNLSFCYELGNLDRLWEELGGLVNLRCLLVVVQPNKGLTSVEGLATALSKMPNLESLQLEFDCFGEYSKMVALAKGGATLNNISSTYRNMLGRPSASSTEQSSQQFERLSKLSKLDLGGAYISDSSIQSLCRMISTRTGLTALKLRFLGDFGKKLRSVENVEDLKQTLEQVGKGIKLFS